MKALEQVRDKYLQQLRAAAGVRLLLLMLLGLMGQRIVSVYAEPGDCLQVAACPTNRFLQVICTA